MRAQAYCRFFYKSWVLFVSGLAGTLLALLLFGQALGGGVLLYGTDTVAHDYIMLNYGWGQLARERLMPLWCPYLFGGFPFIGSFAFCPFYPSQICFAVLPFNTAFTLQYVLALTVAGITSALLALRLGVSLRITLFAGVLFCVSGHFLTLVHAGHLQKMIAIAWAPLVLAGALDWGAKGSQGQRSVVLCGVGLAMQLLASHTQIAYATAWAALFLGAFCVASLKPKDQRSWLAFSRHGLSSLVLAVVLSAAQILPGIETSAISNRAAGVPYDEAVETSYPPMELWEYVIPRVFGANIGNAQEPYFGFWGERIVSDYIGWLAVLFALIGLVHGRSGMRWGLGIVAALGLWIGLGKYAGLYRILYHTLPGMAKFRSPGTFMFLTTLGLVQLSALGLDRLGEAFRDALPDRRRVLRFSATLGVFAIILSISMILFPYGTGRILRIGTEEQWGRFGSLLTEKIRLGGTHLFASGALIVGAALLLRGKSLLFASETTSSRAKMALLPGTVAVVFGFATLLLPFYENRAFIRFAPCKDYYLHLWRPYAATIYAPTWVKDTPPSRLMDSNLLDNSGLVNRRASPAGYHPVILGRYHQLIEKLGWYHPAFLDNYQIEMVVGGSELALPANDWRFYPAHGGKPAFWRRVSMNSYFRVSRRVVLHRSTAGLLNALANTDSTSQSVAAQPEFAVARRLSRSSILSDVPIHIEAGTDLAGGIPLSFLLPSSVEWLIWNPRAFAWWAYNKRLSDLYKPKGRHEKAPAYVLSDNPAPVCLSYGPGAFRLDVSAREGIVTAAENYAPGWKAADQRQRALKVFPVNHSQLGIHVPSGAEEIACWYRPFSWRLGYFLFLSGWGMMLGFALNGFYWGRRKRLGLAR